ncbi:MAG: hypothetical protein C0392_00610 [Syntrophus sp. (in: bacteria)]|nr:hypothetical protein [Syntrophus sp. (in: bacteria)]
METLEYFDYQKVAGEMEIPDVLMKQIEKEIKKEFPNDRMMYELHVLRALRSKYWLKKQINQKK